PVGGPLVGLILSTIGVTKNWLGSEEPCALCTIRSYRPAEIVLGMCAINCTLESRSKPTWVVPPAVSRRLTSCMSLKFVPAILTGVPSPQRRYLGWTALIAGGAKPSNM